MFVDFTNVKEATIKTVARTETVEALREMLVEKFGEGNVTQIDTGEFAVALGEVEGAEVCVAIGVTAKDFVDRQTAKRTFKAFDRDAAGAAFADKQDERAAKKAEAAEKKAAKAAKDAEARAKVKAAKVETEGE